jgi:hypothetical protein
MAALIPVTRLLDKLAARRGRGAEIAAVRRRLRAIRSTASEQERGRALVELKERAVSLLVGVEACARCGRGLAAPDGVWPGGACCGGDTATIFSDAELRALAGGGTRPRALVAPRGTPAGCSFRGSTGCSLATRDRPALCVAYACADLRAELGARGDGRAFGAVMAAIETHLIAFATKAADPDDDAADADSGGS